MTSAYHTNGRIFFKELDSDLIVLILLPCVDVLFISKTDSQHVLPEFLEINRFGNFIIVLENNKFNHCINSSSDC